jgi:hypothetical protein
MAVKGGPHKFVDVFGFRLVAKRQNSNRFRRISDNDSLGIIIVVFDEPQMRPAAAQYAQAKDDKTPKQPHSDVCPAGELEQSKASFLTNCGLLPKKKLCHLYPVTSFANSLWQPGDPPPADPWLSVTRLLGFWLFRAQILMNNL